MGDLATANMTSTYPSIPIVKMEDPKTNLWNPVAYVVEKSGKYQNYSYYAANSFSLSNLNFNTPPNNKNMIIGRRLLMKIPLRFTFVGGVPQIGINDAPRAFSFANAILNSAARINGGSVNVIVSEIIHALSKYDCDKMCREKWASIDAVMPDFYQNYSDWSLYGSARSPLANIGENSSEVPRGGFPFVANNDGSYSYVFYQPLYLLSPFESYNDNNKSGFININNLELNLQLGNFSRIWSHSSLGNAITDVKVTYDDTPQLILLQISPQDTTPLPSLTVYTYNNIVRYVTNISGSFSAGETRQVVSQTITPDQIPRRVMIYACRQFADWTFNTSDTFAGLRQIQVQWNNQNNLLSTATEADLYRIACKNGYNGDGGFPAWRNYTGGVLSLNPAEDLSLGDLESNGLQLKFNVTVTANIQNISSQSMNMALYLIFIYDGILSINQDGQCVTNSAILSKENVLAATAQEPVDAREVRIMEGEGAGLFDKLKGFVHTGSKVVGRAAKVAQSIAPQYAPELRGVEAVSNLVEGVTGNGGRMRRRRPQRRYGRGLIGSGIYEDED